MFVLSTLAACTPGVSSGGPTPPPATRPPREAPDIVWSVDPIVGTAVVARWSAPTASVALEVQQGDEVHAVTAGGPATEARFGLLRAGEPLEWRATFVDGGGAVSERTGDLALPTPPAELPTYSVTAVDPARSEVATGLVLMSHDDPSKQSWVVVVDGAGTLRFWASPEWPRKVTRARLGLDGRSVLFSHFPRDLLADEAVVTRIPFDGGAAVDTPVRDQHHDFAELPDGGLAWLAWDPRTVPLGERDHAVMADRVLTGAEGPDPGEPVERFSFHDDYPVAPWFTCAHMVEGYWVDGYEEWTHSNSIVPAEDGGWYVLARNLDGVVRLDPDGAFRWQVGGRDATLPWVGEPGGFSHPHFSWAEGGHLLLFDNAFHSGGQTRVLEIAVDEAAGTAQVVWSAPEPLGRTVPVLGDARRLPGGTTLVAFGGKSQLAELDADGEVVWWMDLVGPAGALDQSLHRVVFFAP